MTASHASSPEERRATRQPHVNGEALAPATDRAFAILELISQAPDGLSIAEIVYALQLSQNSVFRITKTLEARGYLSRREHDKRFLLTGKLLQLVQPKAGGRNLVEESLEVMKQLRDQTTESVVLSVRTGGEIILIQQFAATHAMRIMWDLGTRAPLHCTAPGKAFLAFADEQTMRELMDGIQLVRHTEETITSKRVLLEHLREARRLGYTVDRAELIEGTHCVAAPIFDEGKVVAALTLTGPAYRLPAGAFDQLGEQVIHAANRISGRLRS